MITTRNINVNLDKGKLKLRHVTTKNIDAGVRVEPPKEPVKTKSITTTTLADVADIAEKKRRDDIAAERKLAMKDEKKIVIAKEKSIEPIEIIAYPIAKDGESGSTVSTKQEIKEEKKPWKLMTDEEKKVAIKERTAKMLTTKARKKKEMLG
jgi:hypothetical protein